MTRWLATDLADLGAMQESAVELRRASSGPPSPLTWGLLRGP